MSLRHVTSSALLIAGLTLALVGSAGTVVANISNCTQGDPDNGNVVCDTDPFGECIHLGQCNAGLPCNGVPMNCYCDENITGCFCAWGC